MSPPEEAPVIADAVEEDVRGAVLRCRQCSAPLEFDPERRALKCPYCNSFTSLPKAGAVQPRPLAEAQEAAATAPGEHVVRVTCPNCGAAAEVPRTQAAMRCIYCLSPLTASSAVEPLSTVDAVVPFKLTSERAKASFGPWLKHTWFTPNEAKRLSQVDKLRGTYLPVWFYGAKTSTRWTAELGRLKSGAEAGSERLYDYNWEVVEGTHEGSYSGLVATASKVLVQQKLENLGFTREGFYRGSEASIAQVVDGHEIADRDFRDQQERVDPHLRNASRLTRFHPGFLAGFEAELPAVPVVDGRETAKAEIERRENQAVEAHLPKCDMVGTRDVTVTPHDETFLLALLPIYVLAYKYRGEVFRVLINGVSGEVDGDSPLSSWKLGGCLLLVLAALVALGYALFLSK